MDGMRVLVVEDEVYLAEAIQAGLRLEAIAADLAFDGNAALESVTVNAYDVVVLDRDLPGISGDEVLRRIVAQGIGSRVLMLTAAGALDDKVTGFELGADDYLTKPFELRELVVRLRALVRRPAAATPTMIEYAGVRLDPYRREVYRSGRLARVAHAARRDEDDARRGAGGCRASGRAAAREAAGGDQSARHQHRRDAAQSDGAE
jgi:two-component system response regulator VanR